MQPRGDIGDRRTCNDRCNLPGFLLANDDTRRSPGPMSLKAFATGERNSSISLMQPFPFGIDEDGRDDFDLDVAVADRIVGADIFADPRRAALQEAEADPAAETCGE